MARYALLLAPYTTDNPVELLPACATSYDAGLQEGHHFFHPLPSGCVLYWRQSPLSWLANPLASALCGMHVCGDAILTLPGPFSCEADVHDLLSSTVAKAAPRELTPALQGASTAVGVGERGALAASGSTSSSGSVDQRSGQAPAASGSAAEVAPAVGSAPTQEMSSLPGPSSRSPSAADESPPGSGGGSSSSGSGSSPPASTPRLSISQCGSGCEDLDPRQQLMWAIASRATSISWAPSTPGAAQRGCAPPKSFPAVPETRPPAEPAGASSNPEEGADKEFVFSVPGGVEECRLGSTTGLAGSEGASNSPLASGVVNEALLVSAMSGSTLLASQAPCDALLASQCAIGEEGAHLPRSCSPWGGARSEIIGLIVAQSGYSSAVALLISQVCSGWRQATHEERGMLRCLRWSCLRLKRSLPAGCGRRNARAQAGRLPRLVLESARAGSVSAAVVAARHLEHFDPREAVVYWGKAARRGNPEAQARLGLAYYKGAAGLACDCEEAMVWLSRAAKQLIDLLGGTAGAPAAAAADGRPPGAAAAVNAVGEQEEVPAGRQGAAACSSTCLPPWGAGGGADEAVTVGAGLPSLLMTSQDCRRCLSQVAHILGLLYLDGEGVKSDLTAGIRWLKVAEQQGCMEAGLVLGSLYNTGQYG